MHSVGVMKAVLVSALHNLEWDDFPVAYSHSRFQFAEMRYMFAPAAAVTSGTVKMAPARVVGLSHAGLRPTGTIAAVRKADVGPESVKRAQQTCVIARHPVGVADSAVSEVEGLAILWKVASYPHTALVAQSNVSDSVRVPYQGLRVDVESIHSEWLDWEDFSAGLQKCNMCVAEKFSDSTITHN